LARNVGDSPQVAAVAKYATEEGVDLRAVEMDVLQRAIVQIVDMAYDKRAFGCISIPVRMVMPRHESQ
jgi:hypothetical protein